MLFRSKSLVIKLATLGENHSLTATSYNNIGLAWSNKGNYTKALEFYMKSLVIKLATLGDNHSETAISYNHVGLLSFIAKGDYDTAISHIKKSLAIRLTQHDSVLVVDGV